MEGVARRVNFRRRVSDGKGVFLPSMPPFPRPAPRILRVNSEAGIRIIRTPPTIFHPILTRVSALAALKGPRY
jgi:hypothetical protein